MVTNKFQNPAMSLVIMRLDSLVERHPNVLIMLRAEPDRRLTPHKANEEQPALIVIFIDARLGTDETYVVKNYSEACFLGNFTYDGCFEIFVVFYGTTREVPLPGAVGIVFTAA